MYPLHRTTALSDIKGRLKDGLPCRVIATSLVEAGVDFDFPTVYRAEAGLDSIIQAAGRCNREGNARRRRALSLFSSRRRPIKTARLFCNAERRCTLCDPALCRHRSAEAIHSYFGKLYKILGTGWIKKTL